MNTKTTIWLAFILNVSFLFLEFIFGFLFHSSAILADAVHDTGDAVAIGMSAFFERLSNRKEDHRYTLGYKRFSLLGAMLTATMLITGSILIILENVPKLFHPEPVNQKGMLVLGSIALIINLVASLVIRNGKTRNEAILTLHFLEDLLGWLAVIVVAIILNVTDWYFLDPLLSVVISIFILSKAFPRFMDTGKIFLEAVPEGIDLAGLQEELGQMDAITSVNQFNIWSMDGIKHHAMLHICIRDETKYAITKQSIRYLLAFYQIQEVTIEVDRDIQSHKNHQRNSSYFQS